MPLFLLPFNSCFELLAIISSQVTVKEQNKDNKSCVEL